MRKCLRHKLITLLAVAGLILFAVFLAFRGNVTPQRHLPRKTSALQELHSVISPSSYRFILNQPQVCEKERPFLLLMVPVALQDNQRRTAIRKTWGQNGLVPDVSIIHLFVLGQPPQSDPVLQGHLEKESREHGDIIQMDFVDSYHNLTIKTMMIMHWISTFCNGARYAMKIDADIFLNVYYLVEYLKGQGEFSRTGYITGSVISDGFPQRNSRNKWYLSEVMYPNSRFPPYVSGAGYVFSSDLAGKISWASRFVRPIPLEDVYVGLCLDVLGIKPVYATEFFGLKNLFVISKLTYDRCVFAKRIIVNGFNPENLLHIWYDFQKFYFKC